MAKKIVALCINYRPTCSLNIGISIGLWKTHTGWPLLCTNLMELSSNSAAVQRECVIFMFLVYNRRLTCSGQDPPAVTYVSEFRETTTSCHDVLPLPPPCLLPRCTGLPLPRTQSHKRTHCFFSSWPHSNPPPWLFHTPCSIFSPRCLPLTPSALFNPKFLPSGCLNGGNSAAISGGYKKWACYVSLAKGRGTGGGAWRDPMVHFAGVSQCHSSPLCWWDQTKDMEMKGDGHWGGGREVRRGAGY